jgi:hypothetical protein
MSAAPCPSRQSGKQNVLACLFPLEICLSHDHCPDGNILIIVLVLDMASDSMSKIRSLREGERSLSAMSPVALRSQGRSGSANNFGIVSNSHETAIRSLFMLALLCRKGEPATLMQFPKHIVHGEGCVYDATKLPRAGQCSVEHRSRRDDAHSGTGGAARWVRRDSGQPRRQER